MTVPASLVTLVCLAHAGGNVSLYREWPRRLPSWVRVQMLELPGRGVCRALPVHTEWPALVDHLSAELRARVDTSCPFAVFGHSMGSLVGLELIHAIRRRDDVSPVWFGASATIAPLRRATETHWLAASPETILDKLKERGGTPAELLADRDFLDLVFPVLRADFHLCGGHPLYAQRAVRQPLECPISVLTGRDDAATACADDVAAWSGETRGTLSTHVFDGGHFYLDDAPTAVIACVAAALAGACAPAAPKKREAWVP